MHKVHWSVLLNTVTQVYPRIPCNARNLLTNETTIKFSKRDLLHKVCDVKQSLEYVF